MVCKKTDIILKLSENFSFSQTLFGFINFVLK